MDFHIELEKTLEKSKKGKLNTNINSKAFNLVHWSRIGTLVGAGGVQRKVLAADESSPTNFVTTYYFIHFYLP